MNPTMSSRTVAERAASALRPYLLAQAKAMSHKPAERESPAGTGTGSKTRQVSDAAVSSSANSYRAEGVLYVLRKHFAKKVTALAALKAVLHSPQDDTLWAEFERMLTAEVVSSETLANRLRALLVPSEPRLDEFDSFFGSGKAWERLYRDVLKGRLLNFYQPPARQQRRSRAMPGLDAGFPGGALHETGHPIGAEHEDRLTEAIGAEHEEPLTEAIGAEHEEPLTEAVGEEHDGGLLGGSETPPTGSRSAPARRRSQPGPTRARGREPATTTVSAWLNAELEDVDARHPLFVGETYTLAIGLDQNAKKTAVASGAPIQGVFAEGATQLELTVQLSGDDFDVAERVRPLRFRRSGTSMGRARFDITPTKNGPSELIATVHERGNFLQQLTLSFDVGVVADSAIEATSVGRPLGSAEVLRPRDLSLTITPSASGGFDCVGAGSTATWVHLPIQGAELASAIEQVRKALMKVVSERIFQRELDIPDEDRDAAVAVLAKAGFRLYQKIFYHPAGGADARRLGDYIREQVTTGTDPLLLQFVTRNFPVPWSLLYVTDKWDADAVDWQRFLGMSHVIEQIPLQTTLSTPDEIIDSNKAGLAISVNFNESIDKQMKTDFVARQISYWGDATGYTPSVNLTRRSSRAELVSALNSGDTTDQIVYLYCHAVAVGLSGGGPDASYLVLSDDEQVTLEDLNLEAPTDVQLPGSPLVFLNACESAELSPEFYDGFVPYFMSKGARGVVGTECKTPALFAADWATTFFDAFLDGADIGTLFLRMRRDYYEKHGNPLGLLYGVHCDGDTRVHPAMVRA
jgi:hypothetical protein